MTIRRVMALAGAARAQEPGPGIAENLAAGRSPVALNSRVRLTTGYLDLPRDIRIVPTRVGLTWAPDERVALRLEHVVGQQQIYVKPVPELLVGMKALAGLTILGDGRPVFLVDLNQLA